MIDSRYPSRHTEWPMPKVGARSKLAWLSALLWYRTTLPETANAGPELRLEAGARHERTL